MVTAGLRQKKLKEPTKQQRNRQNSKGREFQMTRETDTCNKIYAKILGIVPKLCF